MLGANGFLIYRHDVDKENYGRTMAIVYKPPGPVLPGVVVDVLRSLARGPNLPDAIVFLGIKEDDACDLASELSGPTLETEWLRFKGRSILKCAEVSLRTGAVHVSTAREAITDISDEYDALLTARLSEILESGLRAVFQPKDVVLLAPPGYAYQKPSGKRERFFLKPDIAMSTSASVAFVSLALYMKLGAARLSDARDLRYLYVDTMAIAPVAYALRDLIFLAIGARSALLVESFHSYGGMSKVDRPLSGTSICLISASATMSMHEQWIAQKEVGPEEVVTLLTAKPINKHERGALFAVDRPSLASAEGPPQLSILMVGENFFPSQETPKKVLLSESAHKTSEIDVFRDLASEGVFDTWRKPDESPLCKPRALFVNGSALVSNDEFQKWLNQQLTYRVRAATKVIIHQADPASRKLAEAVEAFCRTNFGQEDLVLKPASSLEDAPFPEGIGIIVCAAVIGKGSRLLETSRGLRDTHKGPRLYLIGLQVTETRDELKTLPPNLMHSKEVQHDFVAYKRVAIGSSLAASYQAEADGYYSVSSDLEALPPWLRGRANVLGSSNAVLAHALLPCGQASDTAMELREGFAYWKDGYTAGKHHAAVLGTIGVLLQRAREDGALPSERRLSSGSYRHVLLDPENFARFNDGVIQAALLRNAFPSEIDYRADNAASGYMKALIMRMISRAGEPGGEGLFEFLLAIALGRLQLDEEHYNEILYAACHGVKPAEIKSVINFILKQDGAGLDRAHKLPF